MSTFPPTAAKCMGKGWDEYRVNGWCKLIFPRVNSPTACCKSPVIILIEYNIILIEYHMIFDIMI